MATLTVWKFESTGGADSAERTVLAFAQEGLISVHDAATVSWEVGAKKPKTRQLNPTTSTGALGGSFWGLLFGLIFFVPLLGAAVGAAAGAVAGSLNDVGIDDNFINRVRDQITPGTSALFLLSSDAVIDKLRDAFTGDDKPELLFTNLSNEQDAALREVFAE
jgi:uncharacterized membrane protein